MSDRTSNRQAELQRFFDQSPDTAIAYRLTVAQKEMNNFPFLREEFDVLWKSVHDCYKQGDRIRLISFREAMQPFLDLQGFWTYSLTLNKWAEEFAKASGDVFNEARWIHDHADILNQQGKYDQAEQLYQRSEEMYRTMGNDEWALKSKHMRSMVVRAQGRTAEALQMCQNVVQEAITLKLGTWLAHPLYVLALFARDQGDIQRAETLVEESLSLLADTNEDAMKGQCHSFLGELFLYQKKLLPARTHLETSLQLVRQANIVRRIATTQRLLGNLAVMEEKYEEAAMIYASLMELFEGGLDDQPALAQTLFSRAQLMIRLRQLGEAAQMLEGAISLYKTVGNPRRIVGVSFILIKVYIRQGRWVQAGKHIVPFFKTVYASGLLRPRVLFTLLRMQSM